MAIMRALWRMTGTKRPKMIRSPFGNFLRLPGIFILVIIVTGRPGLWQPSWRAMAHSRL